MKLTLIVNCQSVAEERKMRKVFPLSSNRWLNNGRTLHCGVV